MPRKHAAAGAMNLDTMRPGSENDANHGAADVIKKGKGSAVHKVTDKKKKHRTGKTMDVPSGGGGGHDGPQATSIPGMIPVIHDVMRPGRGAVGVPGIISSTTLGPEVRQRLVLGVIESPLQGPGAATGPVSRVQGVDATAYNSGMVHLAGSRY